MAVLCTVIDVCESQMICVRITELIDTFCIVVVQLKNNFAAMEIMMSYSVMFQIEMLGKHTFQLFDR